MRHLLRDKEITVNQGKPRKGKCAVRTERVAQIRWNPSYPCFANHIFEWNVGRIFIRICINIEIKILYKYYNLIDLRRKFYGIFIYFLFGN